MIYKIIRKRIDQSEGVSQRVLRILYIRLPIYIGVIMRHDFNISSHLMYYPVRLSQVDGIGKFYFYYFLKIYFILFYFWLCWVFVAAHGLSLVAASRGYSSLRCAGFSLQWLLLLRSMGSRHVGFSSCGTRAQ